MAETARAAPPSIRPARPVGIAPHTPILLSDLVPSTSLLGPPSKLPSPSPALVSFGPATVPLRPETVPLSSPKAIYNKASSPRLSPRALTGAAALVDAHRAEEHKRSLRRGQSSPTSPNPGFAAINALLAQRATSKITDGTPPGRVVATPRHVMEKVAEPLHSTSSNGRLQEHDSLSEEEQHRTAVGRPAAVTPRQSVPTLVEEPESMDEGGGEDSAEDNNSRPFTFPGLPHNNDQSHDTPSRHDLSYDSATKSAAKRHKCPYCATDFTRHHNLKSHLLTHSQEKPYICQTCNSRFRRLHDLKRHSKLHTGERPHICPKCGRKFARGDALARHNKGPGGCANRKSSLGGEDGDDDMDDMGDGMDYENDVENDGDDGELDGEAIRRVSEPSRKRPRHDHTTLEVETVSHRRQSLTYPPPHMKRRPDHASSANMGPPPAMLSPGSRTGAADHGQLQQPQYYPQPSASSYSLPQVTESPRPLSPRGQEHQPRTSTGDASALRSRSPSLGSNYHQQQQQQQQQPAHYARSSVMPSHGHNPLQHPPLPSFGSLAGTCANMQQPVMISASPSYTPPTYGGVGGGATQTQQSQQKRTGSTSGSHSSSHGPGSTGSSIRDILGNDPADLMAYIRSIEQRFSRMQDEYELRIGRLQADVLEMKQHLQLYKR